MCHASHAGMALPMHPCCDIAFSFLLSRSMTLVLSLMHIILFAHNVIAFSSFFVINVHCLCSWHDLNRYPNLSEDDFVNKCPFCRNICNCKACLRMKVPKEAEVRLCYLYISNSSHVGCMLYMFTGSLIFIRMSTGRCPKKMKLNSHCVLCTFCSLG